MKKILCVDDDPSLLCLYHDELTEEGPKVILAKDGQEALMKFEKDPLTWLSWISVWRKWMASKH